MDEALEAIQGEKGAKGTKKRGTPAGSVDSAPALKQTKTKVNPRQSSTSQVNGKQSEEEESHHPSKLRVNRRHRDWAIEKRLEESRERRSTSPAIALES